MSLTWENVPGHFGPDQRRLYDEAIEGASEPFSMVEVGALLGRSTLYAAQQIKASGKDVRFWTVDHFKGSPELRQPQFKDQWKKFRNNLKASGLESYVMVIAEPSVDAARHFRDQSLDFVFIDAAHDYENVCADIRAWAPKVRGGGLLAGDDFVPGWPGVQRAVRELLPRHRVEGRLWLDQR